MKILFKGEAFAKLRAYIQGIDYEISGFGKVTKTEDLLIVEDVKIFKQTVTGGNTILDQLALAKFWDELMVSGEDMGKWKLWWHSHVNMVASFSGTDYDTIEEFDTELPEDNWMLSIVGNKHGVLTPQLALFEPIRCTIKNVPYDIDTSERIEPVDVKEEIKEKVTIVSCSNTRLQKTISWLGPRIGVTQSSFLTPEQRTVIYKRLFEKNPSLLPPEVKDGEIVS